MCLVDKKMPLLLPLLEEWTLVYINVIYAHLRFLQWWSILHSAAEPRAGERCHLAGVCRH